MCNPRRAKAYSACGDFWGDFLTLEIHFLTITVFGLEIPAGRENNCADLLITLHRNIAAAKMIQYMYEYYDKWLILHLKPPGLNLLKMFILIPFHKK